MDSLSENEIKQKLIQAEEKAEYLFEEIQRKSILVPGKTEQQINQAIFELAYDLLGIQKYWHKRIVRVGKNTLLPYDENPPNLTLKKEDILFLDFGPILDQWEADYGRTYVLGEDPVKHKLVKDVEDAWWEAKAYFDQQAQISGDQLYRYTQDLATQKNWEFGGEIAGHLIGLFPHKRLEKEDKTHYIHPENPINMLDPDSKGNVRNWILEIHFIDREREIGGFFEQLLTT
ncbi:MAG: M24 family metallopeptidase [Flavobacteriaceae bacterium]